MKRFWMLLSLCFVFILAVSPLAALAQEDEEIEMEVYEDENGLYTISYPVDWIINTEEEGAIIIANSEEAIEVLSSSEDLAIEEGQFGIAILFAPAELLAMLGMDTETEMTPEEIVAAVAEAFMGLEEGEEDENAPVFGEPILVEVDEETSIPVLPLTIEALNVEGAFLVFEGGEGIYVIATAGAPTGEFEQYEEIIVAILDSLEFNVTAEELMELYLGDPDATEEPGD